MTPPASPPTPPNPLSPPQALADATSLDAYLAQADSLRPLFVALNDEGVAVRATAVRWGWGVWEGMGVGAWSQNARNAEIIMIGSGMILEGVLDVVECGTSI